MPYQVNAMLVLIAVLIVSVIIIARVVESIQKSITKQRLQLIELRKEIESMRPRPFGAEIRVNLDDVNQDLNEKFKEYINKESKNGRK